MSTNQRRIQGEGELGAHALSDIYYVDYITMKKFKKIRIKYIRYMVIAVFVL